MDTEELNNLSPENGETSALNHQQLDQVREERLKFDAEFLELQDPRSSSGRLIYAFVRRTLLQFHLSKSYKEAYILNEAYIRAAKLINNGEVIRNSQAWLRTTAYNIIRELKREQQRSAPFEEHITEVQQPSVSPEDLRDDLETLRMAFQMLDPKDQKLLNLKIVEECSWKKIREILKLEGDGDHSEQVLRKRKERALIRLRKKYHAIKPPEFSR